MSSSNDRDVFSTVHGAVAAVAPDSTTDDSDNSGGVKGPVVPETKGNNDVDDAMVDDKNKSDADDASKKECACKVIVGGGEVVGQEKKDNNDDVVVAAAVNTSGKAGAQIPQLPLGEIIQYVFNLTRFTRLCVTSHSQPLINTKYKFQVTNYLQTIF
jgi:hypothetical protein